MDSTPSETTGAKSGSGRASGDRKASAAKRSGPQPPPPPPPLQPMNLPSPPAADGLADGPDRVADSSIAQSLASKVVDDGDLIEKEWVTKVKQIVEQYRNDPYRQSEELTLLRANYMQRRYNKTVKLSK